MSVQPSNRAYLLADPATQCYTRTHYRYMGLAAFWLVWITLGIPAFFLWLLRRFKARGPACKIMWRVA